MCLVFILMYLIPTIEIRNIGVYKYSSTNQTLYCATETYQLLILVFENIQDSVL